MRYSIFLISSFFLLIAGCTSKGVLPHHDHSILLDLPYEQQQSLPDLKGKTFIVELEADYTLQPVGAYLHPGAQTTLIEQSYVISQPGYVLLEKTASLLEKKNAKVYKKYSQNLMNNISAIDKNIAIRLNAFEFYYHEDGEMKSYVSRAVVNCTISNGTNKNVIEKQIVVKVPGKSDIFDAIAAKVAQNIIEYL